MLAHESNPGWRVVRMSLGAILVVAAVLKGYQLATEPTLETSIWTSRWFLIVTVEFELVLGLWLLAGLYARATWPVLAATFCTFAGVALSKGLRGDTSCGCFGNLSVSPWYTLAFDLAALTAIVWFRPKQTVAVSPLAMHPAAFAAIAALVAWPTALVMANYSDTSLSPDGRIMGGGKVVVLDPESWVGRRCPLLRYVDIADNLAQGEWLIVLFRHDCPKCHRILASAQERASRLAPETRSRRIALVEVPPFGDMQPPLAESPFVIGKLTDAKKWLVTTPVVITLSNSVVRSSHSASSWRDFARQRVSRTDELQ